MRLEDQVIDTHAMVVALYMVTEVLLANELTRHEQPFAFAEAIVKAAQNVERTATLSGGNRAFGMRVTDNLTGLVERSVKRAGK